MSLFVPKYVRVTSLSSYRDWNYGRCECPVNVVLCIFSQHDGQIAFRWNICSLLHWRSQFFANFKMLFVYEYKDNRWIIYFEDIVSKYEGNEARYVITFYDIIDTIRVNYQTFDVRGYIKSAIMYMGVIREEN